MAAPRPCRGACRPASPPAGFDSAEIAQSEWARLAGRFADYMAGKTMVVQEASLGGRTFYRLRAMGFGDIVDARRFCTALIAEGADCVPLVNK